MTDHLFKNINLNIRFVNHLPNCNNNNHKIPWRRLYDYELLFVTDGRIFVQTEEKSYPVEKNQLHIMSPFIYHTRYFAENENCSYYNAHLDFFANPYENDFSVEDAYIYHIYPKNHPFSEESTWLKRNHFSAIKTPEKFLIHDPQQFTERFEALFQAYSDHDELQQLNMKAKGYELFLCILRESKLNDIPFFTYSQKPYDTVVSNFIALVKEHYSSDIDVQKFVSTCGLSKNYFIKIFKDQIGVAPHTFLINFRIDQAKALMMNGNCLISEVAAKVGYEDPNYFSRIFKQKEKLSPSEFLNSLH